MAAPDGRIGDEPAPAAADSVAPHALWSFLADAPILVDALDGPAVLPAFPAADESCLRAPVEERVAEDLSARARAMRRDPGLDAEAGARTGMDLEPVEDERRDGMYVGLSWEVMQGGFLANGTGAELLETQERAARVRAELERVEILNRCRVQAVRRAFAPISRRVLAGEAEFLRRATALYTRSYLAGERLLDDVLEVEGELAGARAELAFLTPAREGEGYQHLPPIIDVDVEEMIRRVGESGPRRNLLDLAEREAALAREAARDDRLRLFLRYNVDPGPDGNGVSAGLTWRMPLMARPAAGLEAELEAEQRRHARDQADKVAATRVAEDAFRAQLSRTLAQHYLHLQNRERVRRSLAMRAARPSEADLSTALQRVGDLYRSSAERAAALRELYAAATHLFVVADIPFDPELLRVVDVHERGYRGRVGERSVYAWSATFNRLSNGWLLQFLRAKGITRVAVSAGRETDASKLREFLGRAEGDGIEVELLYGVNAWAGPGGPSRAAERMRGIDVAVAAVHLDVEPHAIDGFQENEAEFLERYVALLDSVRAALPPATALRVSVPLGWPEGIYDAVRERVDGVSLMAYGTPDPERLIERVRPVLAVFDARDATVALRSGDFDSAAEIESAFALLEDAFGVRQFAIHDLEGMLAMGDVSW